MPTPPQPVKYDIAIADQLSAALVKLQAKIDWYLHYRKQLAGKLLDCPDAPPASVPWQGGRRRRFDGEYDDQHRILARLASEASSLGKLVDRATAEARDANK